VCLQAAGRLPQARERLHRPHLRRHHPPPPLLPARWYFDYKTKWYYGGEPTTWTQQPGLDPAARFEHGEKEGGPAALEELRPAAAAAAAAGPGSAVGGSAAAAAAAAAGPGARVVRRVIQLPSHPLAAAGGYQLPSAGRVGGAKGVGHSAAGGEGAAAAAAAKRKREEETAKAKGKVRAAAACKRRPAGAWCGGGPLLLTWRRRC
jgi:hypothetical protein